MCRPLPRYADCVGTCLPINSFSEILSISSYRLKIGLSTYSKHLAKMVLRPQPSTVRILVMESACLAQVCLGLGKVLAIATRISLRHARPESPTPCGHKQVKYDETHASQSATSPMHANHHGSNVL